jgi:protein-L-isoaspartate(D-aspartate) O-methyltransferase
MELRIRNIRSHHSDGNWGWPEHEPYDGIIVTAAPVEIPQSLLTQLQIGGRLVMPVGQSGEQDLLLISRTETGFEKEVLNQVSFVPMLGGTVEKY